MVLKVNRKKFLNVLMWLFLERYLGDKKSELEKNIIDILFIFIIIDSTCASFWVQFPIHICNVGFISIKWEHNKYRVY